MFAARQWGRVSKIVGYLFAALLCALASIQSAAFADTAGARLRASVTNSCTLISISDGLMVTNTPKRVLSSSIPGGVAAVVQANTVGSGFRVRTIAPLFFTTSPPGQFALFSSSYRVSGATTTGIVPGTTQTLLNGGSNRLDVHIQASVIGPPFANGNYSAIVTVRCE